MGEINVEQIRSFRLHSHHLDKKYQRTDIAELVGACAKVFALLWTDNC